VTASSAQPQRIAQRAAGVNAEYLVLTCSKQGQTARETLLARCPLPEERCPARTTNRCLRR